jgi:hypothetical protein
MLVGEKIFRLQWVRCSVSNYINFKKVFTLGCLVSGPAVGVRVRVAEPDPGDPEAGRNRTSQLGEGASGGHRTGGSGRGHAAAHRCSGAA